MPNTIAPDLDEIVRQYGHYDECGWAGNPDHDRMDPVCADRCADLRRDVEAYVDYRVDEALAEASAGEDW